jgi:hypothetical protein
VGQSSQMKNFLLSLWYKYKEWEEWEFERKCLKHLGMKPQKMYVSKETYDFLIEKINNPDPKQIESLRKLLQRPSLWEVEE